MGIATFSHLFSDQTHRPSKQNKTNKQKKNKMFSAHREKAHNFLSPHREKSTEFSQPPPRKKHGIFSASVEKKARNFLSLHREISTEFSQPHQEKSANNEKLSPPRQPDCALGHSLNKHGKKAKTTKNKMNKKEGNAGEK